MPRLSDEFRRSLDSMVRVYQVSMTEAARGYLSGRGIGPDAVEFYRLGVVDDTIAEHADYAGMLCIPYLTRAGVVSMKFRSLMDGDGKKYINPGYETRLFNTLSMDRADRLGQLAVCEGEFDAMTLDYLCDIPAVAIPGVETYKKHPEWRELFQGYREVLIFGDDDEPGRELAKQLVRDIDTARVIRLPGHDVNKTYLTHGAQGIRKVAGLV